MTQETHSQDVPALDALPLGWSVELDVPLDSLSEHPRNPRKGDEDRIEQSIRAHGFVDVVVAQTSTRQILHGNHRARVAKRVGHERAPVVLWADVDDEEAMRLLLSYNRTSDESNYDRDVLLTLTRELAATTAGLDGSLYTDEDVDELRRLTGQLADDSTDFLRDLGSDDADGQKQHDWNRGDGGLDQLFTLSFPYTEPERDRVVEILAAAKTEYEVTSSATALSSALEEWWSRRNAVSS